MTKPYSNLKPQGERLLVKRFSAETTSSGGIILIDAAQEKPMEGTVLATGTEKSKTIKKGDQVLFPKFAGNAIDDEDTYLIMAYSDVIAVVNHA